MRHQKVEDIIENSGLHIPDFLTPKPARQKLNFRLKKAAFLLSKNYGNISEVAFKLGFNSLTYFSRSFKKYYGVQPSEYVHEEKN